MCEEIVALPLERFQVRERTTENAVGYDELRRDDL
jgi:hypothetical protein